METQQMQWVKKSLEEIIQLEPWPGETTLYVAVHERALATEAKPKANENSGRIRDVNKKAKKKVNVWLIPELIILSKGILLYGGYLKRSKLLLRRAIS